MPHQRAGMQSRRRPRWGTGWSPVPRGCSPPTCRQRPGSQTALHAGGDRQPRHVRAVKEGCVPAAPHAAHAECCCCMTTDGARPKSGRHTQLTPPPRYSSSCMRTSPQLMHAQHRSCPPCTTSYHTALTCEALGPEGVWVLPQVRRAAHGRQDGRWSRQACRAAGRCSSGSGPQADRN